MEDQVKRKKPPDCSNFSPIPFLFDEKFDKLCAHGLGFIHTGGRMKPEDHRKPDAGGSEAVGTQDPASTSDQRNAQDQAGSQNLAGRHGERPHGQAQERPGRDFVSHGAAT
jgi:hypothetical protein